MENYFVGLMQLVNPLELVLLFAQWILFDLNIIMCSIVYKKYICLFYVFGIVADGIVNGHWSLVSFKTQTTIWFLIVLLWITIIVGIAKRFKWRNYIYVCVVSGGQYLRISTWAYSILDRLVYVCLFICWAFIVRDI